MAKISKSVKRRLTFTLPIAIGLFLLCGFTVITYAIRIHALTEERDNLKADLAALKARENVLENEISRLKDPEYIAKFAREKYYYTKNGEYVIRVEEPEKEEVKKTQLGTKVYYLLGGSVGLIFFLSLIAYIKHKRQK